MTNPIPLLGTTSDPRPPPRAHTSPDAIPLFMGGGGGGRLMSQSNHCGFPPIFFARSFLLRPKMEEVLRGTHATTIIRRHTTRLILLQNI